MRKEDLIPYLTKFVIIKMKDGSVDAGYISNHKEIQNDDNIKKLILINGLLHSEINIENIIEIKEGIREDTTNIPIVGYDDQRSPSDMENKINELYEKTLLDDLDIDLEELLKEETND